MQNKYNLRTATKEDARFLFEVKVEGMKPVSSTLSKEPFDYEKEFAEYLEKFEPDKIQVIQYEGKDVGRLRVVRSPESIYIGGVQILPEFQNVGIGKAIFEDLIEESNTTEIPITLEVHKVNTKAISFYKNLNFKETSQTEKKISMEYMPR